MPVHLTSRDSLRIFDVADIWATRTGHSVRLVSANDHAHARGSQHYAGLAVDLHTSDPDGLSLALRSAGYRVLWNVPGHYGHIHAEAVGGSPTRQARALLFTRGQPQVLRASAKGTNGSRLSLSAAPVLPATGGAPPER